MLFHLLVDLFSAEESLSPRRLVAVAAGTVAEEIATAGWMLLPRRKGVSSPSEIFEKRKQRKSGKKVERKKGANGRGKQR